MEVNYKGIDVCLFLEKQLHKVTLGKEKKSWSYMYKKKQFMQVCNYFDAKVGGELLWEQA